MPMPVAVKVTMSQETMPTPPLVSPSGDRHDVGILGLGCDATTVMASGCGGEPMRE